MTQTRLYRSTTNKTIGGVAGGIAEFFDIDPVIVRVIFILLMLFGGSGVLIYLVLWIAVPERPFTSGMFSSMGAPDQPAGQEKPASDPVTNNKPTSSQKLDGSLIGGVLLIGAGTLILAGRYIPRIDFGDLWPLLLVLVGIILIVTSINQTRYRSKSNFHDERDLNQ